MKHFLVFDLEFEFDEVPNAFPKDDPRVDFVVCVRSVVVASLSF